jgi:hypothetical protein
MLQNKKIFLEIVGLSLKNFKFNFFITYFLTIIFFGIIYLLIIFDKTVYYLISSDNIAILFVLFCLFNLLVFFITFYFILNIPKKKVVISYSNWIMLIKNPIDLKNLDIFLSSKKVNVWNYILNCIFILFLICLLFGLYFFIGKYYLILLALIMPLVLYFILNITFIPFKENLLFLRLFFLNLRFFSRFYILELGLYLIGYLLYLTNMPSLLLVFIYCFFFCFLVYFKLYALFAFKLFFPISK